MLCVDSATFFWGGLPASTCEVLPIEISNDHRYTQDDTQDNTKLTNLFAADFSVSLVGVALVFDLHVSWLVQEVVSELCLFLRFLDSSFSPSIAHSFAGACESLRLLVDRIVYLNEVSQPNQNESSGGH